ncbi:MAG: FtsX-like permease family protein [Lagierella massiliensis]|nr:FtsX-like permease family protein [Lagierella massiliensis]
MKAINKDILKEVNKSKGRFFSILIMVAIGVLVFLGLKVTGPVMTKRGEDFLKDTNASDITVKSTLGMDEKDLKLISSNENVKDYEKVYSKDFFIGESVITINSINEKISTLQLVEGEFPKNNKEIVLNISGKDKYKIGDFIKVSKEELNPYGIEEENGEYALKNYNFKVTGFVKSPSYVDNIELGTTNLGSGIVEEIGFVQKENFNVEEFSKLHLLLNYDGLRQFDNEEYIKVLKTSSDDLENLLTKRRIDVFNQQKEDIINKIKDGEKEIEDANKKIEDGKKQIQDAKLKVQEGYKTYETQKEKYEKALVENKKELEDARKKLLSKKPELEKNRQIIKSSEKKLQEAKAQLDKGKQELDLAKAQYEENVLKLQQGFKDLESSKEELNKGLENINTTIVKIEEGRKQLPELEKQLAVLKENKPSLETGISNLNEQIKNINIEIQNLHKLLEENPEDTTINEKIDNLIVARDDLSTQLAPLEKKLQSLNQGITNLETAISEIKKGIAMKEELLQKREQINLGLEQIEVERKKLEEGKIKLEEGKTLLEEKTAQWEKGKAQYDKNLEEFKIGKKKFEKGEREFNSSKKIIDDNFALYEKGKAEGKAQLEEGLKKLQDSEKEIAKNEAELLTKEAKAKKEIDKAQGKLDDARRFLKVLMEPEYKVVSRENDRVLYNFFDEASRLDIISNIFPVFFFFIAILVSLTTMTRMVEEQRIQIGTLKALGYGNKEIIKKYFIYGGLASVIGSVIGIIIGHKLISPIIFSAYVSHYIFEVGNIPYNFKYSILSLAIGVLCTTFAGVLATRNSLKENSASLLRPKPPKGGVRILLERVRFIWKRLSFMQKVTMRNLFRYKRRMLMTIIGISGCTGLIFMGIGIRDSLSSLIDKQYGEIMKYDTIAIYNKDLSPNAFKEYKELLDDDKTIENSKSLYIDSVTFDSNRGPDNEASLMVFENATDLKDFIVLRDRKTKNIINLKKDSVVINEKLATLNNLKVGDTLEIKTGDNNHYKIKVGGINELYAGHNIFMPRDYYEKIFDKEFKTNGDIIIFNNAEDKSTDDLIRQVNDNKSIVSVMNVDNYSDIFSALIGSMDVMVFVIVSFACILAFVVLYNLTNINVSERLRELSTIKVLGFYDNEVTAYIYRETLLLTIIGIFFGYLIGYLMHLIIIKRLIPDNAMLDPGLRLTNFLISGLITIGFALVVMIVIHRKLKKVDMVEALKAVE